MSDEFVHSGIDSSEVIPMKRSIATTIGAAICLFLLILDARTALLGAQEGIQLCLMTVVPSLFPFFVLTALLTSALSGMNSGFLRPLGKLCRMPQGAESVLLIGLVGGYPTGAQSVTQLYHSGRLTKAKAQRLLGFCSNAGPAFIFGICGSLFPETWMIWLLWLVHILSAIATGALIKGDEHCRVQPKRLLPQTLPQALDQALKTIGRVCGWIILFRILIAILNKWVFWSIEPAWKTAIAGLLELTNGCCQLIRIESVGARFVFASVFLSFGGICVWLQTASVVQELGTATYLRGKVLQTTISILISMLSQWLLFSESYRIPCAPVIIGFITFFALMVAVFLVKYEKKSSIPSFVGV